MITQKPAGKYRGIQIIQLKQYLPDFQPNNKTGDYQIKKSKQIDYQGFQYIAGSHKSYTYNNIEEAKEAIEHIFARGVELNLWKNTKEFIKNMQIA